MKFFLHPHYISVIRSRLSFSVFTLINYIYALIWQVEIGKSNRFRGRIIFRKLPNSRIMIGDKCIFNSTKRSNQIGIYSPCMISTIRAGASIEIGDNCGFSGTVIGCAKHIRIGNNVRCGANTLITDSDWHFDDDRTSNDAEIVIEENVWLGYGVRVLKGVHIGKNSLIGACSVVTKDIPDNVVAAGNPCKVIKNIQHEK